MTAEDKERWITIPGHEIYEVSNKNRVRRKPRITPPSRRHKTGRKIPAKLLAVSVNNGYLVAYLEKGRVFYIEKAVFQLFPTEQPIPTLEGEEWRDIAGYEGLYKISNFGRVYSLPRVIDDGRGRNRFIRPRIRESFPDAGGYPQVEFAKNGGIKTILVHRLVAAAFVPNPLNLPFVHHKDENKLNYRPENLEWTTPAGNVRDWFDRRRVVIGTDTIETIAAALATGKSPAEILASLPRKRKPRKSV